METTDRTKHVPPGEGVSFWVAGGSITLKVASEDADGAFALLEEMTLPQGGPPPHINHREDEAFYVLEGELEFTVNGRTIPATAGSVIYVPRGNPHAFENVGTTSSRMLILATPAGLEKFFEEVGEPVTDTSSPPPFGQAEIEKILAAFPKYGVEYSARRRVLMPEDRHLSDLPGKEFPRRGQIVPKNRDYGLYPV